ncbi:transcription factor DYT1-like [Coffea arabica]|uniref:Transcription factor DYT1-like n=1 Tax=Coffea arabica TaxID=13443 RepID=A0ABM4WT36_COFAR
MAGLGDSAYDDYCASEEGNECEDEHKEFKSKNLEAERKRRRKLSDRLLELRSLVPNITNMNKATIITDAIDYIEELQNTVRDLSDQLCQMDITLKEDLESQNKYVTDPAKEMKNWGIETEVKVTRLNGAKLWIQVVFQKKIGGFTKLMEAISVIGYDPKDVSVTTVKGALCVTSCVEAIHDGCVEVDQIKNFLLETTRRI